MAATVNTFIKVNELWSYNFVGGLKEYITLNMEVVGKVYHMVTRYLVHRRNFHLNCAGSSYNAVVAELFNEADKLGMPAAYFQFYCDLLFRELLTSFNMIQGPIEEIVFIANDKADIIGFVVTTKSH